MTLNASPSYFKLVALTCLQLFHLGGCSQRSTEKELCQVWASSKALRLGRFSILSDAAAPLCDSSIGSNDSLAHRPTQRRMLSRNSHLQDKKHKTKKV